MRQLHRARATGNPIVKVNQGNYRTLRDGFTPDERRAYDELIRRHGPRSCSSCRQGRIKSCQWELESVEQVVIGRRQAHMDPAWRYHAIDYRKLNVY